MNCGRLFSAITAVMMCAGMCGCQSENGGTAAADSVVSETVLSDKEDISVTESEAVSTETSEAITEKAVPSFTFNRPDDQQVQQWAEAVNEPVDGTQTYMVYLKLSADGTYSVVDLNEYSFPLAAKRFEEEFSKYYYENEIDDFWREAHGVQNYEEYKQYLLENEEIAEFADENGKIGFESGVYFQIYYVGENSEPWAQVADYVFSTAEDEYKEFLEDSVNNGEAIYCIAKGVTQKKDGVLILACKINETFMNGNEMFDHIKKIPPED